jgi:hypothetical protein
LTTSAANAAHESRRDVRLGDNSCYRISSAANESVCQTFRSSRGDGSDIFSQSGYPHSPRHPPEGEKKSSSSHELAGDSGSIDRDVAIFPGRSRDSGDSIRSGASERRRLRRPNHNNGSEDEKAEKSDRNLSAGKFEDQDARGRLDLMAFLGNAEVMGPRGVAAP